MDIDSLDFGNDSKLIFVADTSGSGGRKKGLGVRPNKAPPAADTEEPKKPPPAKRKRTPKKPTAENTPHQKHAKFGGKPASSVETIEDEIKNIKSDMEKLDDRKKDTAALIIQTEEQNQDGSKNAIILALRENQQRNEIDIDAKKRSLTNATTRLTAAKKKESNNKTLLEKKEEEDTKRAEWLLAIEARKLAPDYTEKLAEAKATIEPLKLAKNFNKSIKIVFEDSSFILDYIRRNEDEGYIYMLIKAPIIEGTIEWFNCANIIDERMKQDSKKKK